MFGVRPGVLIAAYNTEPTFGHAQCMLHETFQHTLDAYIRRLQQRIAACDFDGAVAAVRKNAMDVQMIVLAIVCSAFGRYNYSEFCGGAIGCHFHRSWKYEAVDACHRAVLQYALDNGAYIPACFQSAPPRIHLQSAVVARLQPDFLLGVDVANVFSDLRELAHRWTLLSDAYVYTRRSGVCYNYNPWDHNEQQAADGNMFSSDYMDWIEVGGEPETQRYRPHDPSCFTVPVTDFDQITLTHCVQKFMRVHSASSVENTLREFMDSMVLHAEAAFMNTYSSQSLVWMSACVLS